MPALLCALIRVRIVEPVHGVRSASPCGTRRERIVLQTTPGAEMPARDRDLSLVPGYSEIGPGEIGDRGSTDVTVRARSRDKITGSRGPRLPSACTMAMSATAVHCRAARRRLASTLIGPG